MPATKDPKALLWEFQLKKEHKLLSERLDQIRVATEEYQPNIEKIILEPRQATEASLRNYEAKLNSMIDRIYSLERALDSANNEHRQTVQELERKFEVVTRKAESLEQLKSATEESLRQASLRDRENQKSIEDLQHAMAHQHSAHQALKEQLDAKVGPLEARLDDIELYGSGAPKVTWNQTKEDVTTKNRITPMATSKSPNQPQYERQLPASDLPQSMRNSGGVLPVNKAVVPSKIGGVPLQAPHGLQTPGPGQILSICGEDLSEDLETSVTVAAAADTMVPLQQIKKGAPPLNTKKVIPKHLAKTSPRRSRRIADNRCQPDPAVTDSQSATVPETTLPRTGNKRDSNGLVKLRLPTIMVPQSPLARGTQFPAQSGPDTTQGKSKQLQQKLHATRTIGHPPFQALSPVKTTSVRVNAPQKENRPSAVSQVVNNTTENEIENEYTKLHIDPKDPTRVKRRRRIPP